MLTLFHNLLYVPIYNILIFIVSLLPHADLGLALIGVTIIVRLIILPLSLSAVRTQRAMKAIEPELKILREEYKDDKEKLAKETFALYKKYQIRPFASIITVFIQLPILIALYLVVRKESLYQVNTALLYPFIHAPTALSPLFLGLFLIAKPSIVLAILAALTQFLQAHFAIPLPPKKTKEESKKSPDSMQEEFGRALALQARFMLPVIIGVVAYSSGAIALYFITSNILMLLQELLVRNIPNKTPPSSPAELQVV